MELARFLTFELSQELILPTCASRDEDHDELQNNIHQVDTGHRIKHRDAYPIPITQQGGPDDQDQHQQPVADRSGDAVE